MSIGQVQNQATADSESVQQRLAQAFSRVEAYQSNPVSIRVRIFDERFRRLSKLDRIDLIEPFLEQFAADVQQQLIFILCLAPGEETDPSFWALNREFEDPAASVPLP